MLGSCQLHSTFQCVHVCAYLLCAHVLKSVKPLLRVAVCALWFCGYSVIPQLNIGVSLKPHSSLLTSVPILVVVHCIFQSEENNLFQRLNKDTRNYPSFTNRTLVLETVGDLPFSHYTENDPEALKGEAICLKRHN